MKNLKKAGCIILLTMLVFVIAFTNISNADWPTLFHQTVEPDVNNVVN